MFGFRHVGSLSQPVVPVRSRRGLLRGFLLSLALLGVASCGTDEKAVTIPPFAQPAVDLVVDQTYPLVVQLNQPAPDPLTVIAEVEADFAHAIQVSPTTLSYNRGEQSKTVRVTAKAPTAGRYATVTFTVVDGGGAQQVWRASVEEPAQ
jgi:hypothetical protein